MSYEALLNELEARIIPNSKQPSVKLVADGNIPLEKGVELLADIKKIGYEKVVIATQPKQN